MSKVVKNVGQSLGLVARNRDIPKPPEPVVPQVPAQAATAAKTDAGANVVIGTTAKDQRVSGRKAGRSGASGGNVLGGLGRGGLAI